MTSSSGTSTRLLEKLTVSTMRPERTMSTTSSHRSASRNIPTTSWSRSDTDTTPCAWRTDFTAVS
jgi:hypothetical protein